MPESLDPAVPPLDLSADLLDLSNPYLIRPGSNQFGSEPPAAPKRRGRRPFVEPEPEPSTPDAEQGEADRAYAEWFRGKA